MADNFKAALAYVYDDEGIFSDDPGDRGGATKYGITHIDFDRWRDFIKEPRAGVHSLTREEAALIYETFYWQELGCNALPHGLDYCAFDLGVNSGVARSHRYLAESNGTPAERIIQICDRRAKFLTALAEKPSQLKFKRGWLRRVKNVKARALAMAKGK